MALERKEIVAAALDLLNEVGMDKLSTRALAARLGVAQPALYWHFRKKADLLDAINEEMLLRYNVRRLPQPGESWDDFTLANARCYRQALLAVRDGARINAGTRPTGDSFADAEAHLSLLVEAGFPPGDALAAIIVVVRFAMGFVLEEQAEQERAREDTEGADVEQRGSLEAYPILSAALRPLIAVGTINAESVFEDGLGTILDGLRQRLARIKAARQK